MELSKEAWWLNTTISYLSYPSMWYFVKSYYAAKNRSWRKENNHHFIQITLHVENLDMVEDGTVSD